MKQRFSKEDIPQKAKCGATAKHSGKPCQKPAGWGTDHPGVGKCRMHGGSSKGPVNKEYLSKNKPALKTGQRETIFFTALNDEEQDMWREVKFDKLLVLDHSLRICHIRIVRMLQRIQKITGQDFYIDEKLIENATKPEGLYIRKSVKRRDVNMLVNTIEDSITRVQNEMRQIIAEKRKIEEMETPDGGDELYAILLNLKRSREKLEERAAEENCTDNENV